MVIVLRGPDKDARRRAQASNRREGGTTPCQGRCPVGSSSPRTAFQLRGREALARRRGKGPMVVRFRPSRCPTIDFAVMRNTPTIRWQYAARRSGTVQHRSSTIRCPLC